MAVAIGELTRELEELIDALDRRVPRVEEIGEAAIARDAAALREKAIARLAELTRGLSAPAAQTRAPSDVAAARHDAKGPDHSV